MKTSEKLLRKLRQRAGESIGEVLIALLISTLGIMLLASMVTSSVRLVDDSKAKMQRYINAENAIVAQGSSTLSGEVSMTYYDTTPGRTTTLHDGCASEEIAVKYYVNTEIGEHPVVTYKAGA